MITASIVLYKTNLKQLRTVVNSYVPSEKRILYLVDNSPAETVLPDDLKSKCIEYIFTGKNLGYGAAHNIAIKKSIGVGAEYHVVLNPDLRFKPTILNSLEKFMNDNSDAVYVLPKVVYPNGELQYLCKLLPTPSDLIFRRFIPSVGFLRKWKEKKDARYYLKESGYDHVMNPPCLSGCFMFLRLSVLVENNIFFDDRFFMYFEDFDLIRRLHRIGKTLFYPDVEIVHDHARESYKSGKMLRQHMKSAVRYFGKYGWFFDGERRRMNREIIETL